MCFFYGLVFPWYHKLLMRVWVERLFFLPVIDDFEMIYHLSFWDCMGSCDELLRSLVPLRVFMSTIYRAFFDVSQLFQRVEQKDGMVNWWSKYYKCYFWGFKWHWYRFWLVTLVLEIFFLDLIVVESVLSMLIQYFGEWFCGSMSS